MEMTRRWSARHKDVANIGVRRLTGGLRTDCLAMAIFVVGIDRVFDLERPVSQGENQHIPR